MTEWKGHKDQRYGGFTYSQHGDDIFVVNLFDLLGIEKPSYLDIGAHHPTIISNTKLLYDRGSRGVNVDANPNVMADFARERPEDQNLNIGVASQAGFMTFYMDDPKGGRNTFDAAERDQLIAEGRSISTMETEVVNINDLVQDACGGKWPDFLSIDAEGLDYEILKSANFLRGRPKVICAEIRKPNTAVTSMMMRRQGFICHCRIAENLIFVDREILAKLF